MGGPSTRLHWGPALLALAASVLLASPATAASAGVAGRVVAAAEPIADATVYAYQTVEKSLRKVLTDDTGRFRFGDLPAGLYKIVAHKSGFLPTVAVVAHKSGDEVQFVEVELAPSTPESDSESFWTLRSEIPSDVLRDLEAPLAVELTAFTPAPRVSSDFLAQMTALTGVEQVGPDATAQVATGSVGLVGRVGAVRVNLQGDFRSVDSGGLVWAEDGAEGRASAVRLNLRGAEAGAARPRHLQPAGGHGGRRRHLPGRLLAGPGQLAPAGRRRRQHRIPRPVRHGERLLHPRLGRSRRHPARFPRAAPRGRATPGSWATTAGCAPGLRYREQAGDYVGGRAFAAAEEGGQERWVDAYGRGDWEINSLVVVQYGLFTTLRDGSVSLTPRGGVVLRFTPDWQASLIASRRVKIEESAYAASDFPTSLLERTLACEDSELSRYQVGRARQRATRASSSSAPPIASSTGRSGCSIRRLLRAQRRPLPGAGRPAAGGPRFAQQRLSPAIVARVSSNYAAGGGGGFLAQNRRAYENDVSLLSTGVDTTFERTSTGVYLAFHRLEQQPGAGLEPGVAPPGAAGRGRLRAARAGAVAGSGAAVRPCRRLGGAGRYGGVAGRDLLPRGSREPRRPAPSPPDRRRRPLLNPPWPDPVVRLPFPAGRRRASILRFKILDILQTSAAVDFNQLQTGDLTHSAGVPRWHGKCFARERLGA